MTEKEKEEQVNLPLGIKMDVIMVRRLTEKGSIEDNTKKRKESHFYRDTNIHEKIKEERKQLNRVKKRKE